jgi:hypothetical protein
MAHAPSVPESPAPPGAQKHEVPVVWQLHVSHSHEVLVCEQSEPPPYVLSQLATGVSLAFSFWEPQ